MNREKIMEMAHREYSKDYSCVTSCMELEVVEDLVSMGGSVEDEGYVTFPTEGAESVPDRMKGSNKFGVVVSTAFLDYYDGGRWVKKIWAKVEYEIPKDVSPIEAASLIEKNVVENMSFGAFRDEDSYQGMFRLERGVDNDRLSFFVNPAYPDGAWHNHTL